MRVCIWGKGVASKKGSYSDMVSLKWGIWICNVCKIQNSLCPVPVQQKKTEKKRNPLLLILNLRFSITLNNKKWVWKFVKLHTSLLNKKVNCLNLISLLSYIFYLSLLISWKNLPLNCNPHLWCFSGWGSSPNFTTNVMRINKIN